MRTILRYGYYGLSLVPLMILPSCFAPFGARAPGLVPDSILALLLIAGLSPLLTLCGILIATFAPKGTKTGPVIATLLAALPGLLILIFVK